MGQPGYREIADAIRADITAPRLVEGDRLPTVRDMANQYGVPTGTVARALDLLRAEGVIVSRHGRGLYVRSFSRILRSSPKRLSRQVWGAGQAIQDADTGQRLRVVHVEVTEVAAPAAVAEALGIPEGAEVLSRARKFTVEDRIVQTATSYIPLDVVAAAPAIAYTGPGPGGMYARMDEAGLGPKRFRELLDFRPPTTAERAELALTEHMDHRDYPARTHGIEPLCRGQRDGVGCHRIHAGVPVRRRPIITGVRGRSCTYGQADCARQSDLVEAGVGASHLRASPDDGADTRPRGCPEPLARLVPRPTCGQGRRDEQGLGSQEHGTCGHVR